MKLIAKYNNIDEYYSASMPNATPQFENLIYVPYNSSITSPVEVFEHPTSKGHTLVGFSSHNNISNDDPHPEHQYSMTHIDEKQQLINYKSVLMNDSGTTEITKNKMDIFDFLNFDYIENLELLEFSLSKPKKITPTFKV